MSAVVPQDVNVNEDIAKKAILEAFSLKVKTIILIGEGWDNLVYLVNDDIIFRFPRRKVAISLLEREMWVLRKIAKKLPLAVPVPEFLSKGTSSYPYSFYGHKKLSGTTGCSIELTPEESRSAIKKLAYFLKNLHNLELGELSSQKESLIPAFDRADIPKMIDFFKERLSKIDPSYELISYKKIIEVLCEKAETYKPDHSNFSYIHGDLYHRHLLFSETNQLTGVIDWGDSCVSDPVVDLGILYQFFPEKLHPDFFNIYGEVSRKALDYAKFLGLYYAIALLWYGHDRQDQNLIKSSFATLNRLCENFNFD